MDTVMRCHGACHADVSHKPEPMLQAGVTASEPCRGKSKLMVGVDDTDKSVDGKVEAGFERI